MRVISKMNKTELIDALKELGETPPSDWKVIDLRVRLQEMEEEMCIHEMRSKQKTDLQTWTTRLNMALRKKSTAQAFLKDELNLSVTGNETMMELQKKGLNQVYRMTNPCAQDPVGFGEHSDLTYGELKNQYPKYCTWVVKTMNESPEHGLRLGRLGKWLQTGETSKSSNPPNYMMTKKETNKTTGGSNTSSSQGTSTEAVMAAMAAQVKALTEELQEIRQERPHKKINQDQQMTPS